MKTITLAILLWMLFAISSSAWPDDVIEIDDPDENDENPTSKHKHLCREESDNQAEGRCLKSECIQTCKEAGYINGKCRKSASYKVKKCYCYKDCTKAHHPHPPTPPADGPPTEGPSVEGPPIEGHPVDYLPTKGPSAKGPSIDDPPADGPPPDKGLPIKDPPGGYHIVDDPPAEGRPPSKGAPAKGSPVKDPPADYPPTGGPQVEDPSAKGRHTKDSPPVDDAPVIGSMPHIGTGGKHLGDYGDTPPTKTEDMPPAGVGGTPSGDYKNMPPTKAGGTPPAGAGGGAPSPDSKGGLTRDCLAQSRLFHEICISSTNCGNVCRNEGYTGGKCKGFLRRCYCKKTC